jgi:16S rRNA (cytosine967-C5)-methyltransferase
MRCERESSYASELLHSKTSNQLSLIDHSLTTELVMGVLRWRSVLDSQIAESSSQPIAKLDLEVLIALRIAAYQIRWLDRIPPRAAINESVELVKRARKRSAAPFVNAVLRKLAAESACRPLSESSLAALSAEQVAANSAHPRWLVERWVQQYGLDLVRRICEYDQSVPVTAIRIRLPDAEETIKAEGIELAPGALLSSARRVLRGDITKSTAFRAGLCVIQDEASQLVAALVGTGTNILDCCAAPGGKTAAIADRNSTAAIAALELHPHRARLLRKLLNTGPSHTGASIRNIQVIAADAGNLPFTQTFDRILADVPCSGTGTLARNPEIKWRLMPEDLADLQRRQVAILCSAMAQVSERGRLIYSTCSLEREENEDVVEISLSKNQSFRVIDCRVRLGQLQENGELICKGIPSLTRGPYLRTLPGIQPCDGFFAAILEKI